MNIDELVRYFILPNRFLDKYVLTKTSCVGPTVRLRPTVRHKKRKKKPYTIADILGILRCRAIETC